MKWINIVEHVVHVETEYKVPSILILFLLGSRTQRDHTEIQYGRIPHVFFAYYLGSVLMKRDVLKLNALATERGQPSEEDCLALQRAKRLESCHAFGGTVCSHRIRTDLRQYLGKRQSDVLNARPRSIPFIKGEEGCYERNRLCTDVWPCLENWRWRRASSLSPAIINPLVLGSAVFALSMYCRNTPSPTIH